MTDRQTLERAKRIVVKIGTNTLTRPDGGIALDWMTQFARDVSDIRRSSGASQELREVILVSSGAIGAGCARMGLASRPASVNERQAAAAVGQVSLMRAWERAFDTVGLFVGQMLLTKDELNDRLQYLNARNTLGALLHFGVIPVINENDTVSTDELKIGDNDTLSAHVALLADADLLILLTDQEGLRTVNPDGELGDRIPIVPDLTDEVLALAVGKGSEFSVGGMGTKLQAARMATGSGVSMVIASGRRAGVLSEILSGADVGTLFSGVAQRLAARKRWIAFNIDSSGMIIVDDGARDAIVNKGKSLLAVGVRAVSGEFLSGDAVLIAGLDGSPFARALVNYSSTELNVVKGMKRPAMIDALGGNVYDCVAHRDNLALIDRASESARAPVLNGRKPQS